MKSPERTARDLGAVIETFVARWDSSKIALVGYSFGAGVLPFTYNLLPAATRERVVQLSLLGLAGAANFEIRISGWFGAAPGKDARPIRTALDAIDPGLVQCIYGADDVHSACRSLLGTSEVIRTAGGHHFDGDYGTLALRILDGLHRRAESAVASGHQSGA
jgi:type IV secretory pathway VirJ component